ncbi:MAG: hypothetical protein MUF66_01265 [Gammaproteobacteria bacterium]|jgi:hypothetical protein|nr:hypothetical protein [Gammaproteobacteria bacterium]
MSHLGLLGRSAALLAGGAWLFSLLPLSAEAEGEKAPARGIAAVHEAANLGKVVEGQPPFANAPSFRVITRKKDGDMHPCGDCHDDAESDRTPRDLQEPHDNFKLEHGLHGRGEFWCFTCHRVKGQGGLKTLESERLVFDEAYVVCAQCHSQEARDWMHGAHGKRVERWQGERTLLNCTVCHFQHKPTIEPRQAVEPPPVRRGLARQDTTPHKPPPVWERYAARASQAAGAPAPAAEATKGQ